MMYQVIRKLVMSVFAVILGAYQTPVFALEWILRPSLNVEQVYSDNIRLTDTNKQSALVTEVRPGISINGSSPISQFDLNYSAQALYNAQGDSGLDVNNQLQMNTDYELVRDRLFVESSSSISQQNVSNRQTASDNISGGNNTSTVSTFKLSPYWRPHFQGFADGEFRVTYDKVSSKGGESSLSDTSSFSQNINLNSGNDFSLFSWSLLFNNSERSNSDSEDVSFQDSQAEVRYAIGREWSVFAQAGQSSNSFASNSDSSNNGISYTFGGQWQPSQRFRVEAGYGNNRFVTVEVSPFNRLHWTTTYTNNDIGLNTGDTWNTNLNYTTRRSIWNLSYSEDTVTTQQLLLNQAIFETTDDPLQNPVNSGVLRDTRLQTLTDEVFITKTAALSVSFRTGKSDVSVNVSKTLRTFEQSGDDEDVSSLSASWNWQFTRRSSSNLQAGWQKTESDGLNAFSDERYNFSATLTRNILARLNASLSYQYIDQSSNDNLNSYSENRMTANLSLQY